MTLFAAVARERAVRAAFLFHGNRSERTFAIALSLLGAVAAAQIVGALVLHFQVGRDETRTGPATVTQPSPAVAQGATPVAPLRASAPPASAVLTQNRRAAAHPRASAAPRVSVADELLQVAKTLRAHGDTGNAIAKLQQATALDPDNAEILAELALTYESMQLFDRSNETWRKLKELGTEGGPLGELADMKLKMGVPIQGIPGSTGRSPTEPAGPDDTTGIPDGSAFGIAQVTQTTVNDPEATTKLVLRVGVKKRPNTPVDYTKVKIQVFFYDVVNNDQVLLTDADVSYEWITPGHNWADTHTEVLDVTYLRAKKHYPAPGATSVAVPDSVEKANRAPTSHGPAEDNIDNAPRQYLGYIVRVYYQEELQAVRADPTRLLNLFPPPFTAPPQ